MKKIWKVLQSVLVFAIIFVVIRGSSYIIGYISPFISNLFGIENSQEIESYDGINIVECENLTAQIGITTAHTPIKPEERYQFSQLNDNEKKVYLLIEDAIKRAEVSVDVSDYDINADRVGNLVHLFRADNPQYFYIAREHHITHFEDSDMVLEIRIIYTDGVKNDVIEDNALTISADRQVISQKITEFNAEIQKIIDQIGTDWSDSKKISYIHDYLVENLQYDEAAVEFINSDVTHPAYTCYGAVLNKTAVCEGYAKLFQYLCNLVGVNCNQVSGTGDGEPHMWNVVELDSVWYHTDVTWDDPLGGEGIYRDYYLLDWEEMSASHEIEENYLKIP